MEIKAYFRTWLFILMTVYIASCGGGGGGGGGGTSSGGGDTTAPTVLSTTPANNATGVAINSAVTATFSEAIGRNQGRVQV